MRSLAAAEAEQLVASLGFAAERLPSFAWSHDNLEACTDDVSVCMHRGVAFADDWVREVWIVADEGAWLRAARRYCAHLFAAGARQLRWRVTLPVDPRHEAAWSRYGALPISVANGTLTVALNDPLLPVSPQAPWPHRVPLGSGLSVGAVRFGELAAIAAWAQDERNYGPLGYARPVTLDELIGRALPANPLFHTRLRTHVYVVRRHGAPVGVIFERQRDYEGDAIREIDMVIVDETVPVQAWARASTAIADLSFRRGTPRMVINVRESFAGLATIFGGDLATAWIARAETTRIHYTATAAQFYKSLAARRFLRQRVNA